MKIENTILKNDEKVVFELRKLYRKYGYSCFKMSKFEEYDLYAQNKEFLISDSLITFTDTNSKLMALKPDVTLSIVKNFIGEPGSVSRLYYNENVYRISDKTHQFKEIMQTGLECIGDLTLYNKCEVVSLAAKSLKTVSDETVLTLSHLGVISSILSSAKTDITQYLLKCIEEKNPHGVKEYCLNCGLDEKTTAFLVKLTDSYGEPEKVVRELKLLTSNENVLKCLEEYESVVKTCEKINGIKITADFSLVGDMNYYNGLIFRGYIKGIPTSILSGGEYNPLMRKMGKNASAIGFAVYLDLLERLEKNYEYDVDVLLLYSENDSAESVIARVETLLSEGKSVSAVCRIPEKLRYRFKETLSTKEEI